MPISQRTEQTTLHSIRLYVEQGESLYDKSNVERKRCEQCIGASNVGS